MMKTNPINLLFNLPKTISFFGGNVVNNPVPLTLPLTLRELPVKNAPTDHRHNGMNIFQLMWVCFIGII